MDVEQGNVVTPEQMAQLQPGHGPAGKCNSYWATPLMKDPFHTNRWDYVYSLRDGSTGAPLFSSVSVFFSRTIC